MTSPTTSTQKVGIKPLPFPDSDGQLFWDGCARQELRLQWCGNCGTPRFPPSPLCPACLSGAYDWRVASGMGRIYSFVVVREPLNPAFAGDLPYVVAIIELDEGPHMISNVVEVPLERINIDMRVRVCFEQVSDKIVLPKFRPG